MKRLVMVAVLAGMLVIVLATAAFAAPPTPQAGQTFGPGAGIHTPGTGLANGVVPGAGMMRGSRAVAGTGGGIGMGMGGAPAWAGQADEVETLLGMTDAEIQAERLTGKSLAQIAAAKNVSKDTLVSTILNAKKAILDQQVTAGTLTQAQADAVYANMQQQVPVMVDRTGTGPGCGMAAGQAPGVRTGMGGRWNR